MAKNINSTWFKVNQQILLEYRSRAKDITFNKLSDDIQPSEFFIYRGNDEQLYYTESPRYSDPAASDKSWFLNQSIYQKYPGANKTSYNYISDKTVDISEVMVHQRTDLIEYCTRVINLAKSGSPADPYPHVSFHSNFFYDSIRIYFISGYAMDNIDGITLKVSSTALHETIYDDRTYKEQAEVNILDAYIDKSMLFPKLYGESLSASPLHLLDVPMLMNSKFYDKFIEIEFPSLYGIGVRDHNVYDEDDDSQTMNDPTFVVMYFNNDGSLDTGRSEMYTVNIDANTIIEFGTVSQSEQSKLTVLDAKVSGLTFNNDANTVRGNVLNQPNSNYFNARIYVDSDNGDIIYVPTYGESELNLDIYGQICSGEIRLDANSFLDSETSYEKFNDVDQGGDRYYYIDERGTERPKIQIICELLIDYLYYDFDGSIKVYEDSYSREIDYTRNYQSGVEFWKSRYRPDTTVIEKTGATRMSLRFTCHLKNDVRGTDIIRTASLLLDTSRYTSSQLVPLNINTYKIINKINRESTVIVQPKSEPVTERYVRTYYNATNLVARGVGSGATTYPQGQMTLKLNKTGNVYGIQLFNINNDNVRIPYDMTGAYKYKLVLSTPDGKTSIYPNQDSQYKNQGLGELYFYISGDIAHNVMNVPDNKRFFAVCTDLG